MDDDKYKCLDEILKKCGYRPCKNREEKCKIDPSGGASTNFCRDLNLDILFGFQDIDPMFLLVISEIISNTLSGEMPIMQANSLGNWLQIIAAVIQVFNAQQQYQQAGPGRYYNPKYRNISNPFTTNVAYTNGGEQVKKKGKVHSSDTKKLNSRINELEKEVDDLRQLVEELLNR